MNKENITVSDIKSALQQYYNREKAEFFPRFFKTGKGEYGEGDVFMGVTVPNIRKVAKECRGMSLSCLEQLLNSEIHECRSCALFVLTDKFQKCKDQEERKVVYDFYLAHTSRINNWDLVDCSAYIIVGGWLLDKPRDVLYQLLDDDYLWNKRIAIVSCLQFIRHHDYEDIFRLTQRLMAAEPKPHELLQKACGWMLREVGNKGGMELLEAFLEKYAATMPRTMLRYAVERMSPDNRKYFMNKKNE
ncbi:MAG: DNA alkylation repair protein [Prevotella sp.]|jgi:3-methyladenine DNA glycosylase AlkD